MAFRFITIPLKKPAAPGANSDVDLKSSPSDLKTDLQTKRSSCISKLEDMRVAFEKGGKYMDNRWRTAEGREGLINDVVGAVSLYTTELAAALYKYPVFAYGYFYCWNSPLVNEDRVFFDDFRYDLQCMYFNIAAILMNISEYLLCSQEAIGNASVIEKECYHFLLQAAGYFMLVKDIADDMKSYFVGTTKLAPPEDLTPVFLDFFHLIALAQAQEIGTTKAVENEVKGGKVLVAKLSHQVFKLYDEARISAEKKIKSCAKGYIDVLTLVRIKADVFRALTYCHTASSVFDSDPSEGLWFVSQSDVLAKIVLNHRDQARTKKKKIPFRGDDLIQCCYDIVRRNSERCTKINSLVYRAKAANGPLSLPPPAVLAQKRDLRLPAVFPHQVVGNAPIPDVEVQDSEAPAAENTP
ncbi:putative replication factor A, 51kDa subunit [Trypanosoma grayi]|uniref:putative replication factor A, 51kDa subunit n=1 Tax=Trypanosoma grayi TaxID=71804 RepID=UPI0004F42A69|nr:putative replication factor A, 51kDa subunit [Trypanosoma grayi]KEG13247.1 putative replication factor A, 51kDa subunit [Trypanosoma grayi]